jgi:zinc/manganese transport system permease protein
VVVALLTVWAAIACSYWTDWPIGFFVGLFSAADYGIGRAIAAARAASTQERLALVPATGSPR